MSADAWIAEQREKEDLLRALMAREGLDGILLRRVSSFAWATAGAPSHVNTATDVGEAELPVVENSDSSVAEVIEVAAATEEHRGAA